MEIFEIFRDVFGFDEEWEEKNMEKGREEGWKEGWEEGQKEGQKEGWEERQKDRMTMAKNLLARGVDPVIIAESSGLALDKIQKLAL
jgi:flagellar biosynthesis/type III secretory pathway protein FliH